MQYFLISPDGDGYRNLARDEFFLNSLRKGDMILYLYVNRNAVIIGRNQKPWLECNLNQLDADRVQLVRRVTGGGAVYHDEGNLNFSFICSEERYDEAEQTGIILSALTSLGIRANVTGRNDIEVDGKKFSGNAFCQRGSNRQRHGTLLISANLGIFDRYLHAPKQKLEAKGVKSVRARVCNLNEVKPGLDVASVCEALKNAYAERYGEFKEPKFSKNDLREIQTLYQKHSSWEWRMGEAPHFDYRLENRFSFGMAQICLTVENGIVQKAEFYTDSLDTTLREKLEPVLNGAAFENSAIQTRLSCAGSEGAEIAEWLNEQNLLGNQRTVTEGKP